MSSVFDFDNCLKLEKKDYKEKIEPLMVELGRLQRELKEKKVPLLLIFEGLDSSGKGAVINELLLSLDPRGYKVINNNNVSNNEGTLFKKYWENLPGTGEFHIFDRSWYFPVLNEKGNEITRRCTEINETEKMLVESGTIIIKFFLFISKKKQKKRFNEAEESPTTAWRVTKSDWKRYKNYEKTLSKWENIINQTSHSSTEWNMVCSNDLRGAREEVYRITVESLKSILSSPKNLLEDISLPYKKDFSLDSFKTFKEITPEEYQKKIGQLQDKIFQLQHEVYMRKVPVIIAYEGWDAGGKGGNIKRLVEKMDPRAYDVIPISAPTEYEKSKHYLWRFWRFFPKPGHIVIFDRTWYGRVLVERVENFATQYEWKHSFKEINDMERQWISDGAVLVKFWLNISKDEQLARFKEREENPDKQWKITEDDWRNREKWDTYKEAVEEMVARTSEEQTPWHIVPADNKYYARVFALETIIQAIENRLKNLRNT